MRNALTAALLALPLSLTSYADGPADKQPMHNMSTMEQDAAATKKLSNESFVREAALAGLAEVEMSRLAVNRSKDPQVQKFAQRMVNDHTAAANELKSIAAAKRISVPGALEMAQQKEVDKLKDLSGADFDKAYAQQMRKDHDKVVALFNNAANSTSLDPQLQQYANKTLPTLRDHQNNAHGLKELTHNISER